MYQFKAALRLHPWWFIIFPKEQQTWVVSTVQKEQAVKCMYMCGIKSLNLHETCRKDKAGILHLLLGS